MTGSSIKYLTKEGFRNIWTNRMMSVASIAVLMSCLVLIGSAAMMFLNIDSLLARIEEENVVMVFIDDTATEQEVSALEGEISDLGNIKDIEFVAKEDAWAQQLETMEEAQAEFFKEQSSDIPLPDAYKVTIENLDYFDDTVEGIKNLNHIDTIRENRELAQKLVSIRQGISVIAIVIIAVLFEEVSIAAKSSVEDRLSRMFVIGVILSPCNPSYSVFNVSKPSRTSVTSYSL